ncbi:hypothetical protein MPER_06784, partial [Moniliophthora perniciosa FA553]
IGGKDVFPHNISFRAGDGVKELEAVPEIKKGYDVVLAFSISKWIHLNGGDEGLKRFFHRVHDVLRPGRFFCSGTSALGYVQEGEAYAAHRIGFGTPEHFGTTGDDGFRRPVTMYRKV